MHIADEVLYEIGLGLALGEDLQDLSLRRGDIGLVKRAHAHEIAAHRDSVFPHHKVLGKLERGIDLEVQARNCRVDIGEAHLEVLALVPQVGLRLVHDDAAVARVAREQERIDLDVRQDALPLLAERLGDELFNPKAQDAPALRREERELVAPLEVVVIKERGEVDRRVVDGVLAAALFGVLRVGGELLQVDADKRRGQKTED